MAAPHNSLPPNFILTPQQQSLLFRALTSNQPANASPPTNGLTMSPSSMTQSPLQNGASSSINESPFLDYDVSFGPDDSFDYDFGNDPSGQMIGDLPDAAQDDSKDSSNDNSKASSPDNETDKRSHPDDEDGDKEDGGGKRRESETKVPKKPGRKPLTNEPSSKRKAQNRAAQRAFRERKEQHLKDLENKVKELEKASQAATSENSQLRARVEKMTIELNEYKKRLTVMNNPSRSYPGARPPVFGSGLVNNLNDVNFQFEFPKFGQLPGQSPVTNGAKEQGRSPSYPSPNTSYNLNAQSSLAEKSKDQASSSNSKSRENSDAQSRDALAKYANMFPFDGSNASRTSLDSASYSLGGTNTASPSASSNSNQGPSSSCDTSPEPFTQSPLGFKPMDTLTTIGEEQPVTATDGANNFSNFGTFDPNNFDWIAQQNGGKFDPQLFGDYREPQDSILSNNLFDDSFFNDAFDADFITPYNVAPSPNVPKKNIVDQIDARKEEDDTIVAQNGKLLTCNNIWEKLQNCPKVQTGDIDLDGLCSDLQKKAKCGGTGAVVDEKDFKAVMSKHLGPAASDCINMKK